MGIGRAGFLALWLGMMAIMAPSDYPMVRLLLLARARHLPGARLLA